MLELEKILSMGLLGVPVFWGIRPRPQTLREMEMRLGFHSSWFWRGQDFPAGCKQITIAGGERKVQDLGLRG